MSLSDVLVEPPAVGRRVGVFIASELERRGGGRTGKIGEIGFEQRLDARSVDIVAHQHRFHVNDTPWAHLDIAGTGMAAANSEINRSWGPGWGVRLLDRLVADHYEG